MPSPYIVGTAVIGDRFYGRQELLDQVLTGDRNCFCLMGNRRIGKTSFLRHLEFLTQQEHPQLIGVYWNLQGCRVEDDLSEQLKNGLLDAEQKLQAARIDYDQLEECPSLSQVLRLLKRGVIRANSKILLLIDEAESLIEIGEADKGLLGRLRSAMQDSLFVRTVLCGSRRLSQISQIELVGSEFLDGFEPVVFMSSLTQADADRLISQSHTGEGVSVTDEMATEIKEKTNCHPYLIQSLCLYLYDHARDLSHACDYVMQQGMAEKAFADDYRYLSPVEKDILMQIHHAGSATLAQIQQRVGLDADVIMPLLYILESCGYVRKTGESYGIANYFFSRWLKSNEARLHEIASVVSDAAIQDLTTVHEAVLQDLEDARQMQMSLMPSHPPPVDGLEIAGRCVPARAVSGDFFDYLPGQHPGQIGLVIADVTGKAMKGAMNAVMTDGILHTALGHQGVGSPSSLLGELNDVLALRIEADMNITMAIAFVDAREKVLTLANAAHHAHPLLLRDGEVQPLKGRGLPLGMRAGVEYHEQTFDLQPGDVLVLMTDGIIEARDAEGRMYGDSDRLEGVLIDNVERSNVVTLNESASGSAAPLVDAIINDAISFSGGEREDDMTVVVVKIE